MEPHSRFLRGVVRLSFDLACIGFLISLLGVQSLCILGVLGAVALAGSLTDTGCRAEGVLLTTPSKGFLISLLGVQSLCILGVLGVLQFEAHSASGFSPDCWVEGGFLVPLLLGVLSFSALELLLTGDDALLPPVTRILFSGFLASGLILRGMRLTFSKLLELLLLGDDWLLLSETGVFFSEVLISGLV